MTDKFTGAIVRTEYLLSVTETIVDAAELTISLFLWFKCVKLYGLNATSICVLLCFALLVASSVNHIFYLVVPVMLVFSSPQIPSDLEESVMFIMYTFNLCLSLN